MLCSGGQLQAPSRQSQATIRSNGGASLVYLQSGIAMSLLHRSMSTAAEVTMTCHTASREGLGRSAGAMLICVLLAPRPAIGMDLPLGHPDFYPSPERPIRWNGDGNGAYPGATPPTTWNLTSGENIAWRVITPNWGNSMAIVVGDKVITTAEPNSVLCYSMKDGRLLWANHEWAFERALPREKAQELLREYAVTSHLQLAFFPLHRETSRLLVREQGANLPAPLEAQVTEAEKTLAACGLEFRQTGDPRTTSGVRGYNMERLQKEFTQWNLWNMCDMSGLTGYTCPSTVSDGTRLIYRSDAFNTAAAYDLEDGRTVWMRHFGPIPKDWEKEVAEDPRSSHDAVKKWPYWAFVASPVLADGVLVMQAGGRLRGLRATDGELLWEQPHWQGYYGVGSPTRLRLSDGTWVVITVKGEVVRVRDGRHLGRIGTSGGVNNEAGGASLVMDQEHGIVFMMPGSALHHVWVEAWQLKPVGDDLDAKMLWSSKDEGGLTGCYQTSPVCVDGEILCGACCGKAPTGFSLRNVLTGERRFHMPKTTPFPGATSYSSPMIVGPWILGLSSHRMVGGTAWVFYDRRTAGGRGRPDHVVPFDVNTSDTASAAEFIERNVDNAAVFPPCDAKAGVEALGRLELGHRNRAEFAEKFLRTAIMNRLALDVLELAATESGRGKARLDDRR